MICDVYVIYIIYVDIYDIYTNVVYGYASEMTFSSKCSNSSMFWKEKSKKQHKNPPLLKNTVNA